MTHTRCRHVLVGCALAITSALTIAPLQAQSAQNPSPMSDTTRAHPRRGESRAAGRRAALSIGELFIPAPAAVRRPAAMPLVIHFHGAAWLVEQHIAASASHAALVTVTLGSGSGRYAAPFAAPGRLAALLDEAATAAATLTGRRPTWSSLTLTSWSAGYGAVRAILEQPAPTPRISAIVLLDSLHASYLGDGAASGPRATDPATDVAGLAVFARFAAEAVAGRTRLWVTHSEVYPGTYASTTDTANALLASLDVPRRPVLKWGPLGMQQLSEARRGGLHVLGFAGNSAPDHVDHLHALGEWLRTWKVVR
ncbi:hypothetical protein [Luteitalea sp.]